MQSSIAQFQVSLLISAKVGPITPPYLWHKAPASIAKNQKSITLGSLKHSLHAPGQPTCSRWLLQGGEAWPRAENNGGTDRRRGSSCREPKPEGGSNPTAQKKKLKQPDKLTLQKLLWGPIRKSSLQLQLGQPLRGEGGERWGSQKEGRGPRCQRSSSSSSRRVRQGTNTEACVRAANQRGRTKAGGQHATAPRPIGRAPPKGQSGAKRSTKQEDCRQSPQEP